MGTWQPGNGAAVVQPPLRDGRTVPVVPLICRDAVDPRLALDAVRRGAELIITPVVSAFRSLETRRAQVRATNTGISAIISPTGELTAVAGVHERAALVAAGRPERRATTLMLAWGDWFGPTALAVGVALLLPTTLRRA
jgi:apolipoprotein N-acyltransferase